MTAVGAPVERLYPFTVTVPAGTVVAVPQTTSLPLDDIFCHSITVQVERGPSLAMGFYVQYAGQQIIPWAPNGNWLIVDNYEQEFPVNAELNKGLQVVAYNLGAWNHAVYLLVKGTPMSVYGANSAAPVRPLDLSGLGG